MMVFFGKKLEEKLKERKEQKDSIKDLIPEWNKRNQKRKFQETTSDNSGTFKRPKTYVVHNRGQTIQRSNFSRQYYDYKQRDDNSRATSAATSVDRMNSFRIPKTSKWLESRTGKFPEIPVGGRLKFFWEKWNQITLDDSVLSVIKEGYKLECLQKPMFTGVKKTSIATAQIDVLLKEVEELLSKNAIEIVTQREKLSGFYSTFFLVPKKCGKMRPIINLRPLNRYLKKQHFKMDTLNKVLNVVKPKHWAISIDLTDAFLHVPIFLKHWKILIKFFFWYKISVTNVEFFLAVIWSNFCTKGVHQMVLAVVAYLRTRHIRLVVYLDDWLAVNQCKENLIQDREKCLNLISWFM